MSDNLMHIGRGFITLAFCLGFTIDRLAHADTFSLVEQWPVPNSRFIHRHSEAQTQKTRHDGRSFAFWLRG